MIGASFLTLAGLQYVVDGDTKYVDINNKKIKIDMETGKEFEAKKLFSTPPMWFYFLTSVEQFPLEVR